MSRRGDVTRIVEEWLDDGPTRMPDRVLDAVMAEIPLTGQRRSLRSAWRRTAARPLLAVAASAVATVLTIAALSVVGAPHPTSEPAAPSPTTSLPPDSGLSPAPAWIGTDALRPDVTYYFQLPVRVSFRAPTGWMYVDTSKEQSVIANVTLTASVNWTRVSNVYADPCHWLSSALDPPVGPTVDDLVAALERLRNVQVSAPAQTTIGGLPATTLTLVPTVSAASCDQGQILYWSLARGNEFDLTGSVTAAIVEVHGVRLVVLTWTSSPSPDARTTADLASILDSIAFP